MTSFRHTHASLRFSRSVEETRKALAWHRERCTLLTVTEIGDADKADVLEGVPGWGSFRGRGPGRETGVTWDESVWELVAEPASVQIAETTYFTKRGSRMPLRRAPVVHLRHRASGRDLFVLAVHLPSGVEGKPARLDGPARRNAAYESALYGLARTVEEIRAAWPGVPILLTGDWNLNLRRAWVRDLLEGATGLTALWEGDDLPSRGWRPGSKRIIDFSLASGLRLKRGWIWAKRPGSDHRPIHNVVSFDDLKEHVEEVLSRGEHVEEALAAIDAALEEAEGNRWRTKRVSRAREWLHKIKPR